MSKQFNRKPRVQTSRRGATAVLAMLFLVMFVTLSLAMLSLATGNTQSASNLSNVAKSQDAAETGLRWMEYRFLKMDRPKRTEGNITAAVARSIWNNNGTWGANNVGLQKAIADDFGAANLGNPSHANQNILTNVAERPWTISNGVDMTSAWIAPDNNGATFQLHIAKHPLYVGDTLDDRYIRVTSTGKYGATLRSVSLDFKLDKKIKFAVVGKVPIQLGRNTVVEGNVAMATANRYPPIQMLSDFTHFDPVLATKIQNFETFLKNKHAGYDGRINVNNTSEYGQATSAGYSDYNSDGYIDEYDLFVKQYDSNGDRKITRTEFTKPSTGQLYDANLFTLIDGLGAPLFAGDTLRVGYNDGVIDNSDGYAKIRGALSFATTAADWQTWLTPRSETINTWVIGPIAPTDAGAQPVTFGATTSDMFDLSPTNFDQCAESFRARSGPSVGVTTRSATLITNAVVTATDANGGTVTEQTPYGSTSYQATYRRPVFRNITFRNCQIAKGTNALFDGCTFEGVTFVDMTHDIVVGGVTVTDKTNGMTWSQTRVSGASTFANNVVLISSGTPAAGQMITKGSQIGNNIRFHNCTFHGPVAGTDSTAYTHFGNSWEFTGATLFDNQADETATIVCPNTNIEMGSFTNPNAAPSTLKGVVVAGNIDIRGTSTVDGSLIVTGDGAGNTTLSYFGPSDGDTNPTAMPEGGFGRLDLRYNPYRALPDGINMPIDVVADTNTYKEGINAQ
jgi:hypothetical protein